MNPEKCSILYAHMVRPIYKILDDPNKRTFQSNAKHDSPGDTPASSSPLNVTMYGNVPNIYIYVYAIVTWSNFMTAAINIAMP